MLHIQENNGLYSFLVKFSTNKPPSYRLELQRKMVYSGLGRSRKIRSHRRQLSDPKIHLDIHSGKEDGIESEYGRVSKKALKSELSNK